MRDSTFLRLLAEEQAKLAAAALSQPQQRDAFEYGRVSGLYAGLELAKGVFLATLREAERREF